MDSVFARIFMIFGITVMMTGFEILYSVYQAPVYGYMGFYYVPPTPNERICMWIAGAAPAIWLPISIRRPSQILYLLIYIFVYCPSIQMIFFTQRQTASERISLILLLGVGFAISALCYAVPVKRIHAQRWSQQGFMRFIWTLLVLSLLVNLYVYNGQLKLVSFAERSDHRLSMRTVESNIVADYSMAMVAFCISPFFISLSLLRKKMSWFVVGFSSLFLLYLMSASRAFALTIVYIPGVHFLIHRTHGKIGKWLPMLIGCSFFSIIGLHSINREIATELEVTYFQRTFVAPGYMTPVYFEFFSDHPYTYGSQLKGISSIVEYPYDLPLPFLLGAYLGDDQNSANAHFWAEGMASGGPVGVVILSFMLAFVFWLIDRASDGLDPHSVALMIVTFSIPFANLGLPSILLGGGLGIMICLLAVMPPVEAFATDERVVIGRAPALAGARW